jgi:hypothetical protein
MSPSTTVLIDPPEVGKLTFIAIKMGERVMRELTNLETLTVTGGLGPDGDDGDLTGFLSPLTFDNDFAAKKKGKPTPPTPPDPGPGPGPGPGGTIKCLKICVRVVLPSGERGPPSCTIVC